MYIAFYGIHKTGIMTRLLTIFRGFPTIKLMKFVQNLFAVPTFSKIMQFFQKDLNLVKSLGAFINEKSDPNPVKKVQFC